MFLFRLIQSSYSMPIIQFIVGRRVCICVGDCLYACALHDNNVIITMQVGHSTRIVSN